MDLYKKHWWESRTLWFNAMTFTVSLSGAALQFTDVLDLTDQQAVVAALVLTLVNVFGNTALRLMTDTAIK